RAGQRAGEVRARGRLHERGDPRAHRQIEEELRLVRYLWLAPPLVLGLFLLCYGVEVPIFDQWELVPQLQRLAASTLTFADLALPQTEHQIFYPRCLMVRMARLSHSNI